MFQINTVAARLFRPNALTALVWCAAAAGLIFWVLKFPAGTGPLILATTSPKGSSVSAQDAASHTARAWGAQSAVPEVSMALSSRFQLLGVIANASGQGSALISVDGQAPKAYRVGQTLTDGVTLINLSARQANLGPASGGSAVFSLTMPSQGKAP